MTVSYKVVEKKHPFDASLPNKFYARAVSNGDTDLESLAEIISTQCTVTSTDCIAVLNSLEEGVIRELKQGRIVKLGKLGSFQISISSKGVETKEEVNASAIKKAKIIFRPTKKMRSFLSSLSFSMMS